MAEQALSIKQPWASLVVHGLKTIEIRRWSTRHRGHVLIHTGRSSDPRKQSWKHLPNNLGVFGRAVGGIVGEAELVDCRVYKTPEAFAKDGRLHLNDPEWFQPPAMYGFVFANARPLPFRPIAGSLYFFEVPNAHHDESAAVNLTKTGLLVSVRSAREAAAALEGGADLIDIKEPRRGALGRASNDVVSAVLDSVAGKRPVSAALGELSQLRDTLPVPGLSFVKCGLANLGGSKRWQRQLLNLRERIGGSRQAPELVNVAYVDWKNAAAPPWQDVAEFALRKSGGVLLLDTFDKKWRSKAKANRPATLLDWLTDSEICQLCHDCHRAGVRIALAGSLRVRQILQLIDARPTWFAVRGAACEANKRDGEIHVLKVLDLVELLAWHQK
jgi:(5-formylfuran-3-yl)methyl phosphate synthase